MIPTKNLNSKALCLILFFTAFTITLTNATTEDNYKNDNNFLTDIFESILTENGYKANVTIDPDITGIYAQENGYKLDLAINPMGIGGSLSENNYKLDLIPEKTFPHIPDIAVTRITTSKTIVGQGYSTLIYVTVANQAINYETFYLTIYANSTSIETQTITLTNGNPTTITFTWNTTGFAKGNCTISASTTPVPGETDTADNALTNGIVKVVTPGDVNADGVVNIYDAAGVSAHWYPGPPIGPLGFDANFDIDNNEEIGIIDAAIVSAYWTGPPKGPLDP